ncbi:16812_t:CDS:2 [Entrophospora sp. SA101]|nr:10046_t:CDS:2 [Entrophospora sp. SA101]CAJ0635574.1 6181_t:CDS:2 [Entrophospora sp. SA101]CAJ0758661.1 16812_t:CDS:2 [Entrophospora sp. SA101]CAJ0832274.1 123_t:CDS:2 [Entrophospora sp. SA101]CAJ0864762.1 11429_t:CDS:2 [Entrophospora sp. SA101]
MSSDITTIRKRPIINVCEEKHEEIIDVFDDIKPDNKNKNIITNIKNYKNSKIISLTTLSILTILSFITRFYKIYHPNQVVFDEVHFGKFASYYLRRTYYFDVHPPLGKLMIAGMGWLLNYDGHFLFEHIGDDYLKNDVPYIGLRSLPATLGALYVPLVYLIMMESGYSIFTAILAAILIIFGKSCHLYITPAQISESQANLKAKYELEIEAAQQASLKLKKDLTDKDDVEL